MQSLIPDNRLQDVRSSLLEEIKATKKRIHPVRTRIVKVLLHDMACAENWKKEIPS
jgi:hypothetical protein